MKAFILRCYFKKRDYKLKAQQNVEIVIIELSNQIINK